VSQPSYPYAPAAPGYTAYGFGGWNLDNVDIILNGTSSFFDETDGSYYFDMDSDLTYLGEVDNGAGTVTGYVLAKDWPVGEPSGIKIVNDDLAVKEPKPTNCIMATSYLEGHFLDSTDPEQVICSGPFQSHKRYKLAMLPSTVAGGAGQEQGIDLVFNVESELGARDYQVFQKINNWTDGRLSGFKIEVGTGVGAGFVPAGATGGVGLANLSLSVPSDIWSASQLATFSEGLFGPPDTNHDRPAGFFDPDTRAGFTIVEYPNQSGETDTLNSGATLGSDYADLPAGGAADGQFGPWLANNMLPEGIFWDDDGNPETDAALLAWYGYHPVSDTYSWMGGAATDFTPIPEQQILNWGANLEYTSGVIDDLVNVGLNYVVTVGDVSTTSSQFTIRITPQVDSSGTPMPGYTQVAPFPALIFSSQDASVTITPTDTFEAGAVLTARLGDTDLNLLPDTAETVEVQISSTTGLSDTLVLEEQGENRGVFAGILPSEYSAVPTGTVVTVTYTDENIGDGSSLVKTATTTAVDPAEPPMPSYDISIADFSTPTSLFVGQSSKVSMTVVSDKASEAAVSGEVVISADGAVVLREPFTDLAPNRRFRTSTTWTADMEGEVNWTAAVVINDVSVDTAASTTSITVKPGNKNNVGNR
jgi:hypothetical protein